VPHRRFRLKADAGENSLHDHRIGVLLRHGRKRSIDVLGTAHIHDMASVRPVILAATLQPVDEGFAKGSAALISKRRESSPG